MNKQPRLAWAITGSGHYIEQCLELLLTLDNVDLYLSQAGEEVLKMYGIDLAELKQKLPVYRDKAKSAPPVGLFYKGYYQAFIMAPTTSNTIAKCVLGIADSLVTNLYSQAGKCKVPSIVYPCDTAPEILTTAPGGKKFWVYPRPVDLEATEQIKRFPYTEVVEDVAQLSAAVHRLTADG
ncbi:MAG: flavoprotein [Methylococcales bacterium]|nr:flavoprotein [Methylococcales bacterium]